MFTFRNADWHLLDLPAKYPMWEAAVGSGRWRGGCSRPRSISPTAREGALFVVLRRPLESLAELVMPDDRLDMELVDAVRDPDTPSRRHLLHVLAGRTVTDLDASGLDALATLDGAVVTDRHGQLLAVGAILRHPLTACRGRTVG